MAQPNSSEIKDFVRFLCKVNFRSRWEWAFVPAEFRDYENLITQEPDYKSVWQQDYCCSESDVSSDQPTSSLVFILHTLLFVHSVLFTVRYYRDYIVLFEVSLPHQPVIHTITHHHLEELYYCGVCSAGKWVAMQLRFQQQRENAPQQTSCNKLINKSWRFMLSGVRCTFNNKAVASYCRSLRMNAEKPAGKSTSSELLYLMCKLCSVSCWLADRLFIYLLLLIWWCA